jgi:hypothetical protein
MCYMGCSAKSQQSWSPYENLAVSRRINIGGQCIVLLCPRADGPTIATCCHAVLVTFAAKWVRMGGAALQQWSPAVYGAKARCGVQDRYMDNPAEFFITGPVCELPA